MIDSIDEAELLKKKSILPPKEPENSSGVSSLSSSVEMTSNFKTPSIEDELSTIEDEDEDQGDEQSATTSRRRRRSLQVIQRGRLSRAGRQLPPPTRRLSQFLLELDCQKVGEQLRPTRGLT